MPAEFTLYTTLTSLHNHLLTGYSFIASMIQLFITWWLNGNFLDRKCLLMLVCSLFTWVLLCVCSRVKERQKKFSNEKAKEENSNICEFDYCVSPSAQKTNEYDAWGRNYVTLTKTQLFTVEDELLEDNTSSKLEMGKNSCILLWNNCCSGKYVQINLWSTK